MSSRVFGSGREQVNIYEHKLKRLNVSIQPYCSFYLNQNNSPKQPCDLRLDWIVASRSSTSGSSVLRGSHYFLRTRRDSRGAYNRNEEDKKDLFHNV